MMQPAQREPIFNVPGVIAAVLGLLVAIHLIREFLPDELDSWVLITFALVPARFGAAASEMPGAPWNGPLGLVSHMLLHGDWVHLGINGAWLMAVGSPVARRMPVLGFIAFATVCGIGGALMFMAFHPGLLAPMVGASGAISGLMASAFRLMFAASDADDRQILREDPASAPRLSLRQTLTRRQPLVAIAVWVAVNLLAAFGLSGFGEEGGIAWEAHLGGFFTGLLLFQVFDRGRGPLAHPT